MLPASRRLRWQQLARGLIKAFGVDPVGVLQALPGHVRMQLRRERTFVAEQSWDQALHCLLGAPWPCPEGERVAALLADIVARLAERGLGFGRYTYGGYSDSDESLARAVWCAVRHAVPDVVVETGVARGGDEPDRPGGAQREQPRPAMEHRSPASL